MFNLDHAIDEWAREVAGYCAASVNVNELKDHLHCLVEAYQAEGESPQSALAAAIEKMGERDDIRAAYEADLSWPRRLLRQDQRLQRRLTKRFSTRGLMAFVLGYSVLCASVILLRAEWINWVLLVWLVPTMLVTADPRVRRAEGRFLKRLLRSASGPDA